MFVSSSHRPNASAWPNHLLRNRKERNLQTWSTNLPREERLEEFGRLIDDSLVRYEFLKGKRRDSNHGETAILDLGQLHCLLTCFVLRVQPKRIKVQISREIIRVHLALVNGRRFEKGSKGKSGEEELEVGPFEAAVEDGGNLIIGIYNRLESKGVGQGALE